MLRIGLTGGIGSGKSTVGTIFRTLGIPVYDADHRARELMVSDTILMREVVNTFGSDAYNSDGTLNRKFLADKVFSDRTKLMKLNAIVHPAVRKDYEKWLSGVHEQQPYAIFEAALIFEGNLASGFDAIVFIHCDQELRINRVRHRDKVSREDVLARMENQLPEKDKFIQSDFVIINDGKHKLLPQVIETDSQLRALDTIET